MRLSVTESRRGANARGRRRLSEKVLRNGQRFSDNLLRPLRIETGCRAGGIDHEADSAVGGWLRLATHNVAIPT